MKTKDELDEALTAMDDEQIRHSQEMIRGHLKQSLAYGKLFEAAIMFSIISVPPETVKGLLNNIAQSEAMLTEQARVGAMNMASEMFTAFTGTKIKITDDGIGVDMGGGET